MKMSDSENAAEMSPPKGDEKEEAMDTSDAEPSSQVGGGGGDGPAADDGSKANNNDEAASDEEDDAKDSEKASGSESEDEDDKEESPKNVTPKKVTPKKETPVKEKSKVEEPEKSEDSEEEGDEEPKLGLLEQPVIIESGKRQKRKVERLEISVSTPTEKKLEIPEGDGTKLGEIPAIEHHLNKNPADDLKPIHRLLFGKLGQASMVKKNIKKFNGFTFAADSTEYKKKQQILNKMTATALKPICETLTLERSGSKETLVNRIMEFLLKPHDTGKSIPGKRKRKSKAEGGTKRKRKSKGDSEKKTKKETKKKAKKEDETIEDDDSDDESAEEEKEESASESEEEEKPKKKKAKPEPKKPAPKKSKKKVETSDSEAESEEENESEEEEEEEEKSKGKKSKKKKPPTDDEIKDTIKKILEGANLEEVTMKTVMRQVFAKYPDFDLADKKDFIKSSVKQIIR